MWLGLSLTMWWTRRWEGIWMKGLTGWEWRRLGGRRGAVLLRHKLGLKKGGTGREPPDNPTETITQKVLTWTRLGSWSTYLCVCLFIVVMIELIDWVPPLYKVLSKNTTSKQQHWDLRFLSLTPKCVSTSLAILFWLLPPSLSIDLLIRSVSRWWNGDWWWVSRSWLVVRACCQLLLDILSQFLFLEVHGSWDSHLALDSGGFISSQAKYTDILPCRLSDQSPPS